MILEFLIIRMEEMRGFGVGKEVVRRRSGPFRFCGGWRKAVRKR